MQTGCLNMECAWFIALISGVYMRTYGFADMAGQMGIVCQTPGCAITAFDGKACRISNCGGDFDLLYGLVLPIRPKLLVQNWPLLDYICSGLLEKMNAKPLDVPIRLSTLIMLNADNPRFPMDFFLYNVPVTSTTQPYISGRPFGSGWTAAPTLRSKMKHEIWIIKLERYPLVVKTYVQ